MERVFFFSYAHANVDNKNLHLQTFFEDLCEAVQPATDWPAKDPHISFRDGKDLPLMTDWRPELLDALQTSAVLVCVTSPAYFQSKFCGQEYFIFDQRRRQVAGEQPQVILPVIWFPIEQRFPFVRETQLDEDGMSPLYREKGLRWLKIAKPREYEQCVLAFAEAIQRAWKKHRGQIDPLPNVQPFDQIPNAFAGGNWDEAYAPTGWIPGPGVVNFVFAAGGGGQLPVPPGRYGANASEWRPYHPPETRTIEEIARAAARKHSLRYREIPIDPQLAQELEGTKTRKNLTLVLADPQSLSLPTHQAVGAFDTHTWTGSSLMVLSDDELSPPQKKTLAQLFPVHSGANPPLYRAPVRSLTELDTLLDTTLAELRALMRDNEARNKGAQDPAPAQISSV